MIIRFAVSNYLSFDERQEVSFEVDEAAVESGVAAHFVEGKRPILKLAAFFGANAAGKSNLVIALNNVFRLLFESRSLKNESVNVCKNFLANEDDVSTLEISFYADSVRYDYNISLSRRNIQSEELYYYPDGRKLLFYKRQFVGGDVMPDITFGKSLGLSANSVAALKSATLNNHSVLSSFQKVSLGQDSAKIANLHNWLAKHVHDIDGDEDIPIADILETVAGNPATKKFYLDMLRKADFNIVDFNVVRRSVPFPKSVRERILNNPNLSEEEKRQQLEGAYVKDITFVHASDRGMMEIPHGMESAGTMRFIENLYFLHQAISGEHIILVDEISPNIHEDILSYYLNAYCLNSSKSQLIFTSQQLSLLDDDIFSDTPSAAFFVDKDWNSAASTVVRGDKLMESLSKDTRLTLYKAYKTGSIGATPSVGSLLYVSEV